MTEVQEQFTYTQTQTFDKSQQIKIVKKKPCEKKKKNALQKIL